MRHAGSRPTGVLGLAFITVVLAAPLAQCAVAPPQPAPKDCALPGWVFLPSVQQAAWRGILNCEPAADPRAACEARPDCLAFTSTGWLLGAPAAAECGARRRSALRRLLGSDADPPAAAPRIAEPAASAADGPASAAAAASGGPREGTFKGVAGYEWTWKWAWAPLDCPAGVPAVSPRTANATAAAPAGRCCGTYVANDAGPGAAYELRCRGAGAGAGGEGVPHDNYFAGYTPDHLCRCPAMDKTNGYKTVQQYHNACWAQLGFCSSTRYSSCRYAAPSVAVTRAAARACAAAGKPLLRTCGVVKAARTAGGGATSAKALACTPGRCQEACSLCG
jgi:hypothetical protein